MLAEELYRNPSMYDAYGVSSMTKKSHIDDTGYEASTYTAVMHDGTVKAFTAGAFIGQKKLKQDQWRIG